MCERQLTTMASYNLVYFDVRARGEAIRVLLHYAGVPFTEERYTVPKTSWPEVKQSGRFPFGQLPVLELSDGRRIAQTCAIMRFIAKEHGIAPSSNYEQAQADMLCDAIKDMSDKLLQGFYNPDKERSASLLAKFADETLPRQIKYFDKILQGNHGGNGYFVGDKRSYADIDFFCFFNGWIGGGKLEVPEQLKEHPLLVDLYNKVMNEPKIMEYLKHRKPNPILPDGRRYPF